MKGNEGKRGRKKVCRRKGKIMSMVKGEKEYLRMEVQGRKFGKEMLGLRKEREKGVWRYYKEKLKWGVWGWKKGDI